MATKLGVMLMVFMVLVKEGPVAEAMAVSVPSFHNMQPYEPEMSDIQPENNQLEPNAGVEFESSVRKPWVKIVKAPPLIAHRVDATPLELECEASGTPPPSIRWLRDNKPLSQDDDDYESNDLDESSMGLATVTSRLIINNVLPEAKHSYTCIATSSIHTAFATTHVYSSHKSLSKPTNLSEYLLLNREIAASPSKPRIVLFYNPVIQEIGNSIVLPCKVAGHPRPEVYWISNEEHIITNQHPRMKVLRSGELVIQGLRWDDMGGFTCVARNSIGKDSVTTFVYPLLNENK